MQVLLHLVNHCHSDASMALKEVYAQQLLNLANVTTQLYPTRVGIR
jgi:hypothetical protein